MQGEVTDFGGRAHENWKESARILDAELCHGSSTAVRGLATVLICTNRRLVSADDNRVALRWKDYRIDRPDRWKTMTLHIAGLLFAHGHLGPQFHVPFWVVISCHAAIALGTLFGGWRIVRTMGSKITHLSPMQGCYAETSGATMLFLATWLWIPVSTTHTIIGAIVGVGAARRISAVRWNVASMIVVAWIVTMPAAAFIAASFCAFTLLFG